MKVICFLIVFIKYSYIVGQQFKFKGDVCVISGTGEQGKCIPVNQCPNALEMIQTGKWPQTCGFEGTVPLVCCKGTGSTMSSRKPGDLSKRKCKEYADFAYEEEIPPVLLLDEKPQKVNQCKNIGTPLVVGGEKADFGEFPHMALIGYPNGNDTSWRCGGSIISPNFILTAGHCLYDQELGAASHAAIGMTKIGERTQQIVKIIQVIDYPEYRPPSHYNDIGLLKMKSARMNLYARPACLYVNFTLSTKKSLASGWGKIGFTEDGSKDLLKVKLEFFSNSKCNYTYRNDYGSRRLLNGIREDSQICAGSTTDIKDTCQGDSGGPLQIYHDVSDGAKCMYDIVGITSFGKACGLVKNSPGVYTRVSTFIKWIEDTVWS